MEENPAVVIDNGTTLLKAGFSGDDMPRVVVPTALPPKRAQTATSTKRYEDYTPEEFKELDDWTKELLIKGRGYLKSSAPMERGQVMNWDEMEKVWHKLFYTDLRVDPEGHPLLITEALGFSQTQRERMAQIMFEVFNVPSMITANPSLLALFASGRMDGVIIDAGGATTSIVPIHNGGVVEGATSSMNLGGQDLTDYCLKVLADRGVEIPAESARDHAKNIKEKYGYVALNFDEEKSKQIQHPTYELDKPIALGQELFQTPEAYFRPELLGLESMGLSKLVADSISKCDAGIQSQLYGNIILAGGSSLFKNFNERLKLELLDLAPSEHRDRIKVLALPYREVTAWQGGSMLASLSSFTKVWISKAEYEEEGPSAIHKRGINRFNLE